MYVWVLIYIHKLHLYCQTEWFYKYVGPARSVNTYLPDVGVYTTAFLPEGKIWSIQYTSAVIPEGTIWSL